MRPHGLLTAAAALLTAVLTGAPQRAEAAGCPDIDGPKCRTDLPTGIMMAYLEVGPASGPALILVHGLTDSSRSWSLTMRALHRRDPGLRVLAIDQRGHGDSSMPPAATCAPAPERCFRTADFADDLVALMDAQGIRRATIAGHSLGSFVAQEVALAHPERVERAVLVATAATGTGNVALRDYVLKEPVEGSWRAALEAKGKRYPDDFYDLTPLDADPNAQAWMAKNWVVDPVADPAFIAPYLPETAHVRLGTWIGATRALLATDNTERLRGMRVPTLVLWATQDNIFLADPDQAAVRAAVGADTGAPFAWKQYGARPLPASGAQEDDIGHNVQWGAPEQVAADILSFIATGEPTRDLPRSAPAPRVREIVVDGADAAVIVRRP